MSTSPISGENTKSIGVKASKPKLGLRVWMERVLEECGRASQGFDADPVHDLRVALRRCRSLADGLIPLDPDPEWKKMKKAGKKLFQALGDLRDLQVMEEWIEKLAGAKAPTDPAATRLVNHLKSRETDLKSQARKDLDQFDRKQWREWSGTLPQRASRVRPGSLVYLHLALEKWTAAYELHKRVLRTRSIVGWHDLRIGIKHLRYTVENFLPAQHEKWGADLKELQDLLGEVHDLDVLWATAIDSSVNAFPDLESRKKWRERLTSERNERIARYREKMVGKQSLWRVWRSELPLGTQLRAAALSRLKTWAGNVDPDFTHTQTVSQLAIDIYNRLTTLSLIDETRLRPSGETAPTARRGKSEASASFEARSILQAAAFMHDIGRAKGAKNRQKKSYRMIHRADRPLGIDPEDWALTAAIVRYHRGSLPQSRGKVVQRIQFSDRHAALVLAGILRLAVALTLRRFRNHDQQDRAKKKSTSNVAVIRQPEDRPPKLEMSMQHGLIELRVEGYSALDDSAQKIAAARHLLEIALKQAILIRPLRTSGQARPRAI